MTRAERQKVVSEIIEKLWMQSWAYEKAGLTDEEAFKRAWNESEELPEECREEWDEWWERLRVDLENPALWLEKLEKAAREIIAKRPI